MRSLVHALSTLGLVALGTVFGGCYSETSDDELARYLSKKNQTQDGSEDSSVDEPGSAAGTGAGTSTGRGTSATPSNAGPATAGAAGFAQTCVDEINRYRATKGLPAFQRWTEGESCADTQSQKDGQSGRAHGAFGSCKEMGQNECPGWDGAPETMIKGCLKMMWDEGPGGGHYEAMASKRYTSVACGQSAGRGGTWSVQNFK